MKHHGPTSRERGQKRYNFFVWALDNFLKQLHQSAGYVSTTKKQHSSTTVEHRSTTEPHDHSQPQAVRKLFHLKPILRREWTLQYPMKTLNSGAWWECIRGEEIFSSEKRHCEIHITSLQFPPKKIHAYKCKPLSKPKLPRVAIVSPRHWTLERSELYKEIYKH